MGIRRCWWIAALVAAVLGAAGCASDGDDGSGAAGTAPGTTAPDDDAVARAVLLTSEDLPGGDWGSTGEVTVQAVTGGPLTQSCDVVASLVPELNGSPRVEASGPALTSGDRQVQQLVLLFDEPGLPAAIVDALGEPGGTECVAGVLSGPASSTNQAVAVAGWDAGAHGDAATSFDLVLVDAATQLPTDVHIAVTFVARDRLLSITTVFGPTEPDDTVVAIVDAADALAAQGLA